jgi:polyferredoxin
MVALLLRTPIEVDVLRERDRLYLENSEGLIENVYTLKVANMDQQPHQYRISVEGLPGMKLEGNSEFVVEPGKVKSVAIRVAVDPGDLTTNTNKILFTVESKDNPKIRQTEESRFIGPALGL